MFTRKGLAGFGEREMLGRTQGGAHGGGVWAKIIRYSRRPRGLGSAAARFLVLSRIPLKSR